MRGIVGYGAYLPYWRLERKAIAESLGVPAGSGTRAVASYDEDTTSLAVEAGRAALRGATVVPQALYFATSDPAYADKTNANAIHAALDLPTSAFAVDVVGAVRGAVGRDLIVGARLTGGGFGGATINLVAYHQVEDFRRVVASGYEERTGRTLKPMVCQIVDGAASQFLRG